MRPAPGGLALLAACAVALPGCLVGEVRGIRCQEDNACPDRYFCDVPRTECREGTDVFGAPALIVTKLLDPAGDEVRIPVLPPAATSSIALLPENVGLAPAEDVTVAFAELACFAFDLDEATEPERIEPGARGSIEVAVTPAPGCDGLTIVDWFMRFSGRETRGTFDVKVNDSGADG